MDVALRLWLELVRFSLPTFRPLRGKMLSTTTASTEISTTHRRDSSKTSTPTLIPQSNCLTIILPPQPSTLSSSEVAVYLLIRYHRAKSSRVDMVLNRRQRHLLGRLPWIRKIRMRRLRSKAPSIYRSASTLSRTCKTISSKEMKKRTKVKTCWTI